MEKKRHCALTFCLLKVWVFGFEAQTKNEETARGEKSLQTPSSPGIPYGRTSGTWGSVDPSGSSAPRRSDNTMYGALCAPSSSSQLSSLHTMLLHM